MGRLLTWFGGALGLAALWRFLRREQAAQQAGQRTHQPDPAAELRAKLEQAREAADDRDEFDAAEGQPVDKAEAPVAKAEPPVGRTEPPAAEVEPLVAEVESPSLDERRRAIHEKAQQALGEMNRPDSDD